MMKGNDTVSTTKQEHELREPSPRSRRTIVLGAGAALLATAGLVAGCAPGKSVSANGSPTAEQSTGSPSSQPTATSSPETSPTSIPSITPTPSKTPEASASGITAEELLNKQPEFALISPDQPNGSAEAVKVIMTDIQYALATGRDAFLFAAIGQDGMNSDLGAAYLAAMQKTQGDFEANPDQRLNYRLTPSNIHPNPEGPATGYVYDVEEVLDGNTYYSLQSATLGYAAGDATRPPRWVFTAVNSIPLKSKPSN